MAFARIDAHTTPVSQATTRPDPGLTRLRQPDEGRVSATAVGRRRKSSPTASRYYLRDTQNRTYRWERAAGPGVRPAILTREGYGYRNEIWKKKQSHQSEKYNQRATREGCHGVDSAGGC